MPIAPQRSVQSRLRVLLVGALLLAGSACGDKPRESTPPPVGDGAGHTSAPPPGMPPHARPPPGMPGPGRPHRQARQRRCGWRLGEHV